jgi:hypothetical protein
MLCLCVSVGVLSTFDAYHPDSVRQAVISGLAWALRVSMQATGPLQ